MSCFCLLFSLISCEPPVSNTNSVNSGYFNADLFCREAKKTIGKHLENAAEAERQAGKNVGSVAQINFNEIARQARAKAARLQAQVNQVCH